MLWYRIIIVTVAPVLVCRYIYQALVSVGSRLLQFVTLLYFGCASKLERHSCSSIKSWDFNMCHTSSAVIGMHFLLIDRSITLVLRTS